MLGHWIRQSLEWLEAKRWIVSNYVTIFLLLLLFLFSYYYLFSHLLCHIPSGLCLIFFFGQKWLLLMLHTVALQFSANIQTMEVLS